MIDPSSGSTSVGAVKPKTCEQYRQLLNRPRLSDQEIEAMRKHIILLAQTICEHVWGKKFY
jgi:hypothetical protein